MPAAVRSFWLGGKLAVAYPASLMLMCYLQEHHHSLEGCWGFCLLLFTFQVVIAVLCLVFESPRQLRWYRWSFMLPMSVLWPLVLVAHSMGSEDLRQVTVNAAVCVLPGAPVVWPLGALSVRCDDRRDRRLLGH